MIGCQGDIDTTSATSGRSLSARALTAPLRADLTDSAGLTTSAAVEKVRVEVATGPVTFGKAERTGDIAASLGTNARVATIDSTISAVADIVLEVDADTIARHESCRTRGPADAIVAEVLGRAWLGVEPVSARVASANGLRVDAGDLSWATRPCDTFPRIAQTPRVAFTICDASDADTILT